MIKAEDKSFKAVHVDSVEYHARNISDYSEDVVRLVDYKQLREENEGYKNDREMYKECMEEFIPTDKQDEATLFLSTYGSGLAKDLSNKQN